MRQYFIQIALLLAMMIAGTNNSSAGTQNADNASNATTEQTSKVAVHDAAKTSHAPQSTSSHHPVEKTHSHIPTWDELAHIHHFHKNRLKKVKRHFKKSVFLAKLLLFICHAAVLYISYMHVTH